MVDEQYPVDAPGWAAIDEAAQRVHPGQTPHQFTSATGYDLQSPNPLPAIGVYEGRAPLHWHYVTYGLSELFDKSSPHASVSGLGYELTLSLPREESETRPPTWALSLLQGMGRNLLADQTPLDSGHLVDLGAPLSPDGTADGLTGLICVPDPRLGKMVTPNGSLLFLALFGLKASEVGAMREWDLQRKVGFIADVAPLAVTRPGRVGFAEDRRTKHAYRRAALGVKL